MNERPAQVLILSGPPGSGKTTVAGSLVSRFDRGVHIESDRFFEFIAAGYIEPWRPESHSQNSVVMQIIGDVATGYAKAGYATILEGIFTPGWFFEPIRDALRSHGIEVSYAVLRTSLDITIRRSKDRDSSQVPPKATEQLWQDFNELEGLEHHVINNSDQDVSETADRLADLWERRLLVV